MRIGIIGGALQGMESVYLSKKAGYETLVLDRKPHAPATFLSDHHEVVDVVKETERTKKILSDCDVVIPACEELDALMSLDSIMSETEIPFLFDMGSYLLSCSKERSNNVMGKIGVPIPAPWPECGFPAIVKPSSQSGSIGVSAVNNEVEMEKALNTISKLDDVPIVQEFVSGKSVSIEVIGNGRHSRSYVTTEVVLDDNYDCKMVFCGPSILPKEDEALFMDIGENIANKIGLKALMDVEAILTKKGLRVLEIDARIPSQTPAAVHAATGINLMEELVASALGKRTGTINKGHCSVYEHYVVENDNLITCGEKVFGHVKAPRIEERFFGADEAITDHHPGEHTWRATVINSGRTPSEVLEKRKKFIQNVMNECNLDEYIDRSPGMI